MSCASFRRTFLPSRRDPLTVGAIGGLGLIDAIAVAWALSARPGQQVRLYFVLPVSPMLLLGVIFAFNVLRLIALGNQHDGLVTPFGGMLAGWLFGDTSPVRRFWLERKLERARSGATSGRASNALATFELTRPMVGASALGIAASGAIGCSSLSR